MNDLKKFCVICFLITTVIGIVSHFVYDWTGGGFLIGLFFPVNESTWEHMKLLFYPMVVFSFIEYKLVGKSYKNYWCVKVIGLLVGLTVIPLIYYTYTGALGVSADWFNITIFLLFISCRKRGFQTQLFNIIWDKKKGQNPHKNVRILPPRKCGF